MLIVMTTIRAGITCNNPETYSDGRGSMDAANERVVWFLRDRPEAKRDLPLEKPHGNPSQYFYMGAGTHPDVVERLWDQLGKNLPADSRALVFGTPALVHPESSVVLAFALGTQYALRLPRSVWSERRPAGLQTVTHWTGGGTMDIEKECGTEWIFGSFAADEIAWCEESFRECSVS